MARFWTERIGVLGTLGLDSSSFSGKSWRLVEDPRCASSIALSRLFSISRASARLRALPVSVSLNKCLRFLQPLGKIGLQNGSNSSNNIVPKLRVLLLALLLTRGQPNLVLVQNVLSSLVHLFLDGVKIVLVLGLILGQLLCKACLELGGALGGGLVKSIPNYSARS